jgi:carboxymethylenebutenolidase
MKKDDLTVTIDRRRFLSATLSASLALAARPLWAAAIQTDSAGLTAGDVKVPIQGGDIAAYRAHPDQGGPFPVVLVGHDEFGLSEQMKDVVRRIAKLGYYAICPYLFSRQGEVGKADDMVEVMRSVISKVVDAQVLSDLDATVEFARKSGKGDVGRLGMTGFSWGGRATWIYAAHNPKMKAGVAWYGFLNAPRDPQGHSAVSLAAGIKQPVLGLYAGKDDYIMAYDVDSMKLGLAKSKSEIVSFPGVQHGFFADNKPTYDAKTAADGWSRMQVWLHNNGLR